MPRSRRSKKRRSRKGRKSPSSPRRSYKHKRNRASRRYRASSSSVDIFKLDENSIKPLVEQGKHIIETDRVEAGKNSFKALHAGSRSVDMARTHNAIMAFNGQEGDVIFTSSSQTFPEAEAENPTIDRYDGKRFVDVYLFKFNREHVVQTINSALSKIKQTLNNDEDFYLAAIAFLWLNFVEPPAQSSTESTLGELDA